MTYYTIMFLSGGSIGTLVMECVDKSIAHNDNMIWLNVYLASGLLMMGVGNLVEQYHNS